MNFFLDKKGCETVKHIYVVDKEHYAEEGLVSTFIPRFPGWIFVSGDLVTAPGFEVRNVTQPKVLESTTTMVGTELVSYREEPPIDAFKRLINYDRRIREHSNNHPRYI